MVGSTGSDGARLSPAGTLPDGLAERLRRLAKELVPPMLLRAFRRLRGATIEFDRGYPSWEAAARAAEGYDAEAIMQRVAAATRKVVSGAAVYERDSVVYDEIDYSWPLLSSLLFAAASCGTLRVIDVGGSLGTTFRQNRRFLTRLQGKCEWRVVEQAGFVRLGQQEFSDENITFCDTIAEASSTGVDVILFGGSLFYVLDPASLIAEAKQTWARFIVIDRTPITHGSGDEFAVQRIPAVIYRASFAIRSFAFESLMSLFGSEYEVIEQWTSELQPDPATTAMGFLLERKGAKTA